MNIFDEYKHKSIEDIIAECRNEVNLRKAKLEILKEYILRLDNSIAKLNSLKIKAEELFDKVLDEVNNNHIQYDNDEEYDRLSEEIQKSSKTVEKVYKLLDKAITEKTEIFYTYKNVEQVKNIYQQQVINFELHNHVKYT